ncbi:uncharacterized protein LOC144118360 isoform X1 [Amblyomma americanum]
MASTREKVVYIIYFFAVCNALNLFCYIGGFHRRKGAKIQGSEYYFMLETFLNLVSDVIMLRTLRRPPVSMSVLTERILAFIVWNVGTSATCFACHLVWCYRKCHSARVDLEKIPYNRDAATHRKILFMSSALQYTVIFLFKITLLSVVYNFHQELERNNTKKRQVTHHEEAGDSTLLESGREIAY